MTQNINLKQSHTNHIIYKSLKRTEDIVVATIILILISPIMLIVAIGIKGMVNKKKVIMSHNTQKKI